MTEPKRTERLSREINQTLGTITFVAERYVGDNWIADPAHEVVVFRTDRASDENRAYAMLHGFNQRLGDAAAKDAGTSMADKLAAVAALRDHYESGSPDWETRKAAKPRRSADEMIRELTPENLVSKMTPEQLEAIATMMAERVANRQG